MALGKVNSMVQHVQLRESGNRCLRSPVLMNIAHHTAPGVDVGCGPDVRAKQAMMQLLQPAGEDGVGSRCCCRDGRRCSGSREECCAAFLLDPLADLGPIEVMRCGEQLLTLDRALFAGNVERRNTADALSFCCRQMQQLFRSGALLQMQCFHKAADLL